MYDYAQGSGQQASPVEQTRREFSKRSEVADDVEITDQRGPTEGYYGEALRTLRLLRDGRAIDLRTLPQAGPRDLLPQPKRTF